MNLKIKDGEKEKLCPLIPPGKIWNTKIQFFNNINFILFNSHVINDTCTTLGLHGAINVVSKPEQVPEMSELEKLFPEVELGGRYRPPHCTSRHRVAIIVPFRDREDHLRTFLFNLHTLLPRQQLGNISSIQII